MNFEWSILLKMTQMDGMYKPASKCSTYMKQGLLLVEMQDAQVEDDNVDKSLAETPDVLAILDVEKVV